MKDLSPEKKPADQKKKNGTLEKVIMGVIIGGAIGSVLGVTLAPKSGKETRTIITKKSSAFLKTHKKDFGELWGAVKALGVDFLGGVKDVIESGKKLELPLPPFGKKMDGLKKLPTEDHTLPKKKSDKTSS